MGRHGERSLAKPRKRTGSEFTGPSRTVRDKAMRHFFATEGHRSATPDYDSDEMQRYVYGDDWAHGEELQDAGVDTQDGGAGSGVAMGATSVPIPLARPNNQRTVDHMTLKFAGTTFINPANGANGDNTWSKFPWEFYALFLQGEQVQAINNTHLFWKAEHIHIQFKNPQCIQNLGTTASGVVQSGTNTQAQMFGYLDNMYLNGIDFAPCEGALPTTNMPSPTVISELVDSWDTHGYFGGKAVKVPSQNVSPTIFTSSTPDCKEMGMGGGNKFDFGWKIHNQYWRLTEELRSRFTSPIAVTPDTQGLWRWDPLQGYCVAQGDVTDATGVDGLSNRVMFATNNATGSHTTAMTVSTFALGGTATPTDGTAAADAPGYAEAYVRCVASDPIPGLYLQLQPQVGSLTAGLSESVCQLQWEMEVDIALSGRIPRQQTGAFRGNSAANTLFATRAKFYRVPAFRPGLVYINSGTPLVMEEEKDDEM